MVDRGRTRSPRRVRRGMAAVLVLLALGSMSTQLGAAAQGEGTEIVRGGANASADSMAMLINNAGAALGWTFGRSTAAYRDITATAEGKAVDLGALEALLGQPQCNGTEPPALDLATLPPRTIADSAEEGSEVERTAAVNYPRLTIDSAPDQPVGTQAASATKVPSSQSHTETLDQDFGFFRVEGARSSATTSFENGVRTAEAISSADRLILFGGQVVFQEPVWTARAFSGADSGEEASFEFAWASVFGNYVSGAALERDLLFFTTIVEGLLSPLGVKISFPEVTQPFSGDGISISPMAFTMSEAPIAGDLLIPLLNTPLFRDFREESVQRVGTTETAWTIVDALERALGGSGSVEILVGGATATTDDTDYSFQPFPEAQSAEPDSSDPAPTEPAPDPFVSDDTLDLTDDYGTFDDYGDDFSSDFSTDFSDDYGAEIGLEGELPVESLDVAAIDDPGSEGDTGDGAEITDSREIAAGSDGGGAGNAAAVAVGVLALLGAIGLSLGDRFVGMRARRRIP